MQALLKPKNSVYANRFKKHLLAKLKEKQRLFPELITDEDIRNVKTLKDFDDIYTSKAHGFKDGLDYYVQCSSLQFLKNIQKPTFIINAKNDTFLGPECYPYQEVKKNEKLHMEVPLYGGHVGFYGSKNISYTEERSLIFLEEVL